MMASGATTTEGLGGRGRNDAGQTRLSEQHLLPLGRRRVAFVGGLTEDIDSSPLKDHLRDQTSDHTGIEDYHSIADPSNEGKVASTI